jgi:hypothetical protein
MSIDDEGFLAEADIMVCRNQIRQHYAPYFDLIHRTNALCQQAKFRLDGVSTTGHNLMAVHLLIKLLGDTQGAVLLVERGLASQARALLRTACDTCILLAKVCTDNNFPRFYALCEELEQVYWIKNFLKDKSPSLDHIREEFRQLGMTLVNVMKMEENLKKRGAKRLEISLLAQETKLSGLYYSAYKLYCKDTHASPSVLTSYSRLDQTGNFEEIIWGPVIDNLEDILLMIPRLMLLGLAALQDHLVDLHLGAELHSLRTALIALEHPQNT